MGSKKKKYQLGDKFGNLIFIKELPPKTYKSGPSRMAKFCCFCGNEFSTNLNSVRRSLTKSCGCLLPNAITHGLSKHPLFQHWASMISRCYSKKHKSYKYYGGRGISVCDEWRHNPGAYILYIEGLPNFGVKGLTLDRIKNNEGYYPGNLRWANQSTQVLNSTRKRSSTGYVGVYKKFKKKNGKGRGYYRAEIYNNGDRVFFHYSPTPEIALNKRNRYIVDHNLPDEIQEPRI